MKSPDSRIDPEILGFLARISGDYAAYPPMDSVGVDEKRRIASAVRAPWAQGGPEMARTENLEVSTPAGKVRVRLHYPTTESPLPALVYAHGGGWVFFDLDTHDRVMREYAARAGIVVVGVDYARSPEARYPKALDQLIGVIRWLRESGAPLGIDPRRIAVGGDSAGGNLALCASLKLRDAGEREALSGIVLNYGALDMDMESESHRRYGGGDFLLGSQEMLEYWKTYLGDLSIASDPYACPGDADFRGLPPTFLAVAELDVLHDGNVRVAARLREAGVPVSCTVYPGTIHGFIEAAQVSKITVRALEDTALWLRGTLFKHPG
jgi:acetyl esterase